MTLAETPHKSPAKRRRQRVRSSILEAAERVFAKEGEAGLSIRRLADEVDYSPAAIYKYFKSKDDLLEELKEAFFERLLDEMSDDTDVSADEFRDFFRRCTMTYITVALARPHHYRAAFSMTVQSDRPPSQFGDASNKSRAFMRLHEAVQMGVELGVFRSGLDTLKAAKSVWAAVHGLVMLRIHMPHFDQMFGNEAIETGQSSIPDHIDFILESLCK